jgi:hypothetical protein
MKDPQQQANELPMVEIARQLGFDTDEQIFGFTPFAELWTGRLAMAGFTTGVLEEQLTGDTIIQVRVRRAEHKRAWSVERWRDSSLESGKTIVERRRFSLSRECQADREPCRDCVGD